jgi:exonuclease III
MTLNLTIIATIKKKQMKVSCSINGLQYDFEELKILTEELNPTIVCLQETNVKPEQQKIFGGHVVFSKIVPAEQPKHGVAILVKVKTRIKDEILRGCRKQSKKPDQETD